MWMGTRDCRPPVHCIHHFVLDKLIKGLLDQGTSPRIGFFSELTLVRVIVLFSSLLRQNTWQNGTSEERLLWLMAQRTQSILVGKAWWHWEHRWCRKRWILVLRHLSPFPLSIESSAPAHSMVLPSSLLQDAPSPYVDVIIFPCNLCTTPRMMEKTVALSVVSGSNVRKERVCIFCINTISVEHFQQMLVKSADAEPTNPEGRLLISPWNHLFNVILFNGVKDPWRWAYGIYQ